MIKFILLSLLLCNCAYANSPCTQMIQSLNPMQKKQLEMDISRQESIDKVNILKVFKDKNWLIIYVDPYVSDKIFFFYHEDIYNKKYLIAEWSGGADTTEEDDIQNWVKINAKGIPDKLTKCFSWYAIFGQS